MTINPAVDVEEEIYSFEPANNGAGPLWCHGSTIVIRTGEDVYVTTLETLPDEAPLNNCRWVLYARGANGWRVVHQDETGRTREPCPIAALYNGALLVTDNPNVAREPFCEWIEVANRDATAGTMRNNDIWLAPDGAAHLIWSETTVDERLRDRFFPDETVAHSFEYAAVHNGEVQARRTLARVTEDAPGDRPHLTRFQVMENGTPVLLASFVCDAPSAPTHVYRLAAMFPDGSLSDWVDVPFEDPIAGTFLTSTVRGGSRPASTIDVVGMAAGAPQTLRYARVRLDKGG